MLRWLAWPRGHHTAEMAEEAAVRACRDITLRASMLMDAGDCDGLVDLFTPDLEFVRPSTFPEVSIRGSKALQAAMRARPMGFVSRHVCTNQIVDLLGEDRANVRSYFTHYSGMRVAASEVAIPMGNALRSVGEYEDVVIRTPQGWRIARRSGRFIFGGI